MSSIIGGRSGNRGMCAQPCRLPYEVFGEKGYFLSPKDLCVLSHIKELKKMGVASLKIEGRLKRKEYVSAVCGIYRKYIDSPKPVEKADMDELLEAFNRSGFTDGYLSDKLGRHMMSYENPSNIGENKFSPRAKDQAREDANFRTTGIYISAQLKNGEPLKLSCYDLEGNYAEVIGDTAAQVAVNKAMTEERLCEQLEKLGNTPFFAESVEIDLDEGITLPVSQVNNVRRELCKKYEELRCTRRELHKHPARSLKTPEFSGETKIICQVTTEEQAKVCIEKGITEIYADTALANKLYRQYEDLNIIAKLPPVFRDDREYEKPETCGILISNIGQYDENKDCYGDFRLNITNTATVDFYRNLKRVTLSPELNIRELEPVSEGCEIIGYGNLPLMVMENCPLKALGRCHKFKNNTFITDRMGEKFPLKCNEGCTLEILNSKPVYIADKPEIIKKLKIDAIRLIFTVENGEKCGTIIDMYKKMIEGEGGEPPYENTFTRGHFYRGTE